MAKRPANDDFCEPAAAKRATSNEATLTNTRLIEAGREKFANQLSFDVAATADKGRESLLVVACKVFHWHSPAGFISRARLVVHEDRSFFFQVLLRSLQAGTIETVDQFLSLCEKMANVKREYKFCPGICPSEYQPKYFSKIRYDVKNVRRTEYPFERIDSSDCLMFHKLAKNASIIEKGLECVPCCACKRLVKDLNQ